MNGILLSVIFIATCYLLLAKLTYQGSYYLVFWLFSLLFIYVCNRSLFFLYFGGSALSNTTDSIYIQTVDYMIYGIT